jgi:hypothetical protein
MALPCISRSVRPSVFHPCEELLVCAGRDNALEGRVGGDEVGDSVVDHDPRLTAELRVLHRAFVSLRKVLDECVGRLVHVRSASKMGAPVN